MPLVTGDEFSLERAQARVGTVLRQKWRLDALLGLGGVGAVYAATHRTGSRIAVKLLHPEYALDEDIRARFLREAYVANRIGHPGVVSVLDDDADDQGSPFLVMELLDGSTVERLATRRDYRMDPREALWVADRALEVLAVAHQAEVIHRDIKPENVFVTRDGRLKILDFGVARMREANRKATADGVTMGTLGYMSPEQAAGKWDELDVRADIFAVGATLYAIMAGGPLHDGPTLADQLIAAMTQKAPSLAKVMPSLPAAVTELVDRALAFEKGGRFPDARSMQQAVRAAYAKCAGVALSAPQWNAGGASPPVARGAETVAPGTPRGVAVAQIHEDLTKIEVPAVTPGVSYEGPRPSSRDAATPVAAADPSTHRVISRAELADAYVNRGLGKHSAGDLQNAISDYARAIELSPAHAVAYFNRGLAWQAAGDLEEALLDFGRAADRDASLADPIYCRASLLASRGEAERARADLVRADALYRQQGNAPGARAVAKLLATLTSAR